MRVFNADVGVEALAERVGGDTEHVFDENFFKGLTGVANALDNVDARELLRAPFFADDVIERLATMCD